MGQGLQKDRDPQASRTLRVPLWETRRGRIRGWLAGNGDKTLNRDCKEHWQERERSPKAEWKNSLSRRTLWFVPHLFYMVLRYHKKEQWIESLETCILVLAPQIPSGAVLEKSFNPSLPHLKSEVITLHSHKISHSISSCFFSCHTVLTT